MRLGTSFGRQLAGGLLAAAALAARFSNLHAQQPATADVTFTRDIAPMLQRSCQNCHRPNGVAPMSLVTYDDVRPWVRSIKLRTGLGPRAGVMPPWYVEKNIGIQQFKNDPSLSEEEIAKVARWVDLGAPRGDPAAMPAPKQWADDTVWQIGTPDLILKSKELLVKGDAPDWWGEIPNIPTGLTEDRYVSAVEIKEINDVDTSSKGGRATVGGRFVFHHMIWRTQVLDPDKADQIPDAPSILTDEESVNWPVHEVGRNPDFFDPRSARLLKAGSYIISDSVHLHSNGRDTRSHLEIGFKLMPREYQPTYKRAVFGLGNGVDIDIRAMEPNQQLHAYTVLQQHTKIISFEPHLHAPGARMCLEAIWGYNIQTLNCVGYDHNWVRGYDYTDDSTPLLPKGTILHIVGYMDNSPSNKNVPDPRNWQGSGNRSVANMFIDLGMRVALTDEQFQEEMAKRRERLHLTRNDVVIGCPLCMVPPPAKPSGRQR
jgi:mono/diheme cytochrome c family protein